VVHFIDVRELGVGNMVGHKGSRDACEELAGDGDVSSATHCNALQHTATRETHEELAGDGDVCTATHRNTLRHTATREAHAELAGDGDVSAATHCNTLQHTATREASEALAGGGDVTASHCNTLTATMKPPFEGRSALPPRNLATLGGCPNNKVASEVLAGDGDVSTHMAVQCAVETHEGGGASRRGDVSTATDCNMKEHPATREAVQYAVETHEGGGARGHRVECK